MSGFSGIIATALQPQPRAEVSQMISRLRRSLPVVAGECGLPELDSHLGWSSTSRQPLAPIWNSDGTVGLLLAGDVVSISDDTRRLDSDSPLPEAVLSCYLRHGPSFLRRLNGIFSGVLVDRRRQALTLFNDRFGFGRIYSHEIDGRVYFSTEAKAILAVAPACRELDQRGLAEYVALGCVLQNRTLFRGIHLLPPASAWTYRPGSPVEKARYFDPGEWEQQSLLRPDDYNQQLQEVFARAVKRQTAAVPDLGMSLTGGLDSRAVIAWLGSEPGTLPCYTFGGPYRDCADVRIARQLADICHHPHTTIRIGAELFADFASLAERTVDVSDGTMDITGAVELHVNRFAREIAPVRLTGNYGSEILRYHVALRPAHLDRTPFTPEFCGFLDEALATYEQESRCHPLTFIAFKQVPWHHYARRAVECCEISPRSPFLDNELVALAYRAPMELRASPQPMLNLIAAGNPALASVDTDRALRAGPSPLPARLANRWQEFTAKAEYAYDYGMPQWLARADRMLGSLHLERLFLGRHKFYHFRIWYRDALSAHVRERLIDSESQPSCFRLGAVRAMATDHLSGRANHTLALHKALTLQLIEQLHIRRA